MLTTLQLVEPTRLDGTKYNSTDGNTGTTTNGNSGGSEGLEEVLLWRVTSTYTGSSSDKHKQEQILTIETTSAPTTSATTTTTAGYVSTPATAAAVAAAVAALTPPATLPPPLPLPLPLPTAMPLGPGVGVGVGGGAADPTSAAAAVSGLHNHALLHQHQHHLPPTPASITTSTPLHTTTVGNTVTGATLPPLPPPPAPAPAPAPRATVAGSLPTASLFSDSTAMTAPTPAPAPITTATSAASSILPPISGMMMGSGPGGVTEVLLVPPPEYYRVNHPLRGITIEADKVVQALSTLWPQLSSTATTGPDLDRIIKCLSNPETFTLYLATRVVSCAPNQNTTTTTAAAASSSSFSSSSFITTPTHPTATTPAPPAPAPPALVHPPSSYGTVPPPPPSLSSTVPTVATSTSSTSASAPTPTNTPSSSSPPGLKIQEIIGSLTLVSLNLLMSTRAHIEDLVVSQNERGSGIGKALMKRAMQDAITVKKCTIIDLTSKPDRVQARQMYESLGFKIRDTGAYRYYVQ
ncbi:hypothetical protein DFQ26_004321 [Actinomortierella ambigua]|nr:hypothetical protein DFQ26_004321 [Actinomortierella ambigua]